MKSLKSVLNDEFCFALGFNTSSFRSDPYCLITYDNENNDLIFKPDALMAVSFELYTEQNIKSTH